MYCCNVLCIALWVSHMYNHKGIRRITNAFIAIKVLSVLVTFQVISRVCDCSSLCGKKAV